MSYWMMGVQNNLVFQCCRFFGAFRRLSKCYGKKHGKMDRHRFSQEAREFRFVNFWAFPKHDSRVKTKPGELGDVKQNSPPFFRRHKQAILSYLTNLNSLLKKNVGEGLCLQLSHSRPKKALFFKNNPRTPIYFVIFVTTTSERFKGCWGSFPSSPGVIFRKTCEKPRNQKLWDFSRTSTGRGSQRFIMDRGISWVFSRPKIPGVGTNMTFSTCLVGILSKPFICHSHMINAFLAVLPNNRSTRWFALNKKEHVSFVWSKSSGCWVNGLESSTILTLLHYSRGFNHWSLLLEKRKKRERWEKNKVELGCTALQFQNEALLEVSVDVSSAFIFDFFLAQTSTRAEQWESYASLLCLLSDKCQNTTQSILIGDFGNDLTFLIKIFLADMKGNNSSWETWSFENCHLARS